MQEVRLTDKTAIMEQLRAIEQNSKLTDVQKFRQAKFVIENAPTIEPEARHGRWRQRRNGEYYCTNCGREEKFIFQKSYCPRCGARMDLRTPTEVQLDEADDVMMGGADNG